MGCGAERGLTCQGRITPCFSLSLDESLAPKSLPEGGFLPPKAETHPQPWQQKWAQWGFGVKGGQVFPWEDRRECVSSDSSSPPGLARVREIEMD